MHQAVKAIYAKPKSSTIYHSSPSFGDAIKTRFNALLDMEASLEKFVHILAQLPFKIYQLITG
jgi:hypothetical protein